MDPIKIPQNVYVEDRIIGPITLRQIILCCIGGGISYVLWASLQNAYGYATIPLTVIAWTPAAIFAAFAFVKIQNLSLLQMCFLLLEQMSKPSIRRWGARSGITIIIHTEKPEKGKTGKKEKETEKNIEELSSFLDTSYEDENREVDRSRMQVEPKHIAHGIDPIFSPNAHGK